MNKLFIISALAVMFLFTACSKKENADKGSFYLTHRKLKKIYELGPAFMQKLSEDLYNAVINGEIDAYKTDSLNEATRLTKEKAAEVGKIEQVIQYIPNPDYPDYYIDSLVVIPFTVKDIRGFEISEKWTKEKGEKEYHSTINALALRYEPVFGGVKLHEQAMFWVRFDDLQKIIKKDDLKAMTDLIFESMLEKVTDY